MFLHKPRCAQASKGSVLIMALLLTAVIAAISAEILLRTKAEIRQSEQVALNDRIYLDLQGYQYWAILTLAMYPQNQGFSPAVFKPRQFEWGAAITGSWQDQQGLFNLNALKSNEAAIGFSRLLRQVDHELDEVKVQKIINAIRAYFQQVGRMESSSELRSVQGVSQKLYLALEKYVTALPSDKHEININGIDLQDPTVLVTVSGLGDVPMRVSVDALLGCLRVERGLIKTKLRFDEFKRCVSQKTGVGFHPNDLTYFSRYYLASGRVRLKGQQHVLYSFLERVPAALQGGQPSILLRWQSLDAR